MFVIYIHMKNLIHNHSPPLFVLIQKIDTEGLYLLVLVNMFNKRKKI